MLVSLCSVTHARIASINLSFSSLASPWFYSSLTEYSVNQRTRMSGVEVVGMGGWYL